MKKANNNGDIEYFYENSKFFKLLLETKKYEEFYCSFEGKFSGILAVLTVIIFFIIYNNMIINTFNEIIRNTALAVIAGLIGILGFVVAGFAIITGTISESVVNKINKNGLSQYLIGILFSFYFLGFVIGIALTAFWFLYILSFLDFLYVTKVNLVLGSFIYGYLFWFIIWYAIALLGTCLRIFLVNYRFSNGPKTPIEPPEKVDESNYFSS